ncbi:winged helix-turn-helix domain-containing protein, partial [Psychrobacter sp. NPDC078370]|uniref:winged helix-turn-helix domain-containing protein n=1 Tax=Psychrobacter sp. NPDC078370 TaxID=3390659 RepID=UPI003CFD6D53
KQINNRQTSCRHDVNSHANTLSHGVHYFATHSGKVLNREQLWQAMPNDDSSDNIDRAIDVHISRLRALIEDNPRQPKRIITVRGVGYQFATDQV